VVVSFSTGIIRIDPVTGDRTLVSGCIERHCRGSGPDLSAPTGIAVEADRQLVVVSTFGAVVRVNPDTGVRTSVSGSGPPLHSPEGIAVEENGPPGDCADRPGHRCQGPRVWLCRAPLHRPYGQRPTLEYADRHCRGGEWPACGGGL
jgi:hypothetical protein